MLNAAQLLGSCGGIFLGSRTVMFLCGAGVWNLKNVLISALCVHEITGSLMEWYITMFCVIILYVLKLAGQASLSFGKVYGVNDTALPLLHTLTKRHHYSLGRFFRWQILVSFPMWLRRLFTDEIWLGLHLRNIDLVLWQSPHICATKRCRINSSDADHHWGKKW